MCLLAHSYTSGQYAGDQARPDARRPRRRDGRHHDDPGLLPLAREEDPVEGPVENPEGNPEGITAVAETRGTIRVVKPNLPVRVRAAIKPGD